VGLNSLKSLNLTNVYPNNKKNNKKKKKNNKVKSKPLELRSRVKSIMKLKDTRPQKLCGMQCELPSRDLITLNNINLSSDNLLVEKKQKPVFRGVRNIVVVDEFASLGPRTFIIFYKQVC
jgi:hypothetical protein